MEVFTLSHLNLLKDANAKEKLVPGVVTLLNADIIILVSDF